MSEEQGLKPPDAPRNPCEICDSTDHTTGYHESGVSPRRDRDSGVSPEGYHEAGVAPEKRGRENRSYPTSLDTETVLENRAGER